jgi:hypothetical protein
LIVLNSLFPVFLIILLGNRLKRGGVVDDAYFKASDKLVYYIFFPAMLFWKIGGAGSERFEWGLCLSGVFAAVFMWVISLVAVRLFRISTFQAGTFSQCCFRFNTYIGMAIVLTALGEEGVRLFGILIAFAIPVINVMAVSTLIWFSGQDISGRRRLKLTLKELVVNPLILGCLSGIVYSRTINVFPVFLDNTFRLLSSVTLPLALLSIGGALTLEKMKGDFRVSAIASFLKLVCYPLVGFAFLRLFAVPETAFRVGMIFFTLPTATSAYVLSSQLNSDTELASSIIVLSTVLSFPSLTVGLML